MNVAVVIPSYKRPEKLERCLKSILNQTYQNFEVHVFFDNQDEASASKVFELLMSQNRLKAWFNPNHEYVIGSWNKFTQLYRQGEIDSPWKMMMWCVDDVELESDCLEKATDAMRENFPDYDGVIGISQECPGHPEYTYKPYGQVLLGKQFIDRYKEVDYKVCCPAYTHFFQDQEMYAFADSLGKFYHCREAILNHYHPSFIKSEMDETHSIVRGEIFQRDRQTFAERTAKGLVWGKSWKLS